MSKKLLKAKNAASPIEHFTNGEFRSVIGEAQELDNKKVKRVLCCSGQVYFDLLAGRSERDIKDIAIVRLEQLYPFPADELKAELSKYPNAKEIMWAQEEPRNQGAWHQLRHRLEDVLEPKQVLQYAGRPSSASPAVGYMSKHNAQLKTLVDDAMKL